MKKGTAFLSLVALFSVSFLESCESKNPTPSPSFTTYNFLYYDGNSIDVEVPEGKDVKDYYPGNTPKHDDTYIEYSYTWEYKQHYLYQEKQHETKISVDYLFNCADGRKVKVVVPRGHSIEEYKSSVPHSEDKVDTDKKVKTVYNDWKESGATSFDEVGKNINIYKITYEGVPSGISNPNPEWVDENVTYVLKSLAETSKIGYNFNEWLIGKNPITEIKTNTDLTIKASLTPIEYKITYRPEGLTHTNPLKYTVETETINLTNPTKLGYTYNGWHDYTYHKLVTTIPKGTIGDIYLYTTESIETYKITYHDVGDQTFGNPTEYNITTPTINLNPAEKNGYSFEGWYTDKSYAQDKKVESIPQGSTGNIDLYGYLKPIQYTIEYIFKQGGSATGNPTEYTIESSEIDLKPASKLNSHFDGWYDAETGGNKIEKIPTGTTGNITLYAKFTDDSYSITYVGDFTGATNPNVTSYTYYEKVELGAASKEGYDFGGWFKDEDREITTGGWEAQTTSGNQTIYSGGFTAHTYHITYHLNSGTDPGNPTDYNIETETFDLLPATKNGYSFDGWYDAETGGNKVESIIKGTKGDMDLYARYIANKYNSTFNLDGGVAELTVNYIVEEDTTLNKTVTFDSESVMPKIYDYRPEKSNYFFAGWYEDSGCTKLMSNNTSIIADLNAYGKFLPMSVLEENDAKLINDNGSSEVTQSQGQEGRKTLKAYYYCPYHFASSAKLKVDAEGDGYDASTPTATAIGSLYDNTTGQRLYYIQRSGINSRKIETVDINLIPGHIYRIELTADTKKGWGSSNYSGIAMTIYPDINSSIFSYDGTYQQTFDVQAMLPNVSKTGSTLIGWQDEKGNPYEPGIWIFTEDKTFIAIWE